MKMILLALGAAIHNCFFAADKGGDTGEQPADKEGQTVADVQQDVAALHEEFAAAGLEVPLYPGTPAGIAACRKRMAEMLEEHKNKPAAEETEDEEAETSEDLQENNDKADLLELAREEGVEGVSERDNKETIADAIVAKRKG